MCVWQHVVQIKIKQKQLHVVVVSFILCSIHASEGVQEKKDIRSRQGNHGKGACMWVCFVSFLRLLLLVFASLYMYACLSLLPMPVVIVAQLVFSSLSLSFLLLSLTVLCVRSM